MPITETTAVIVELTARFSLGHTSQLEISVVSTDSNGTARPQVYRVPPTPSQQTAIDNFISNIIAQVQTATNLTVSVNPL